MFWLLITLMHSPLAAEAQAPHLPPEMSQKYDEAKSAVAEGYRQVRLKAQKAERNSSLVDAIAKDLGKIWASVKARGRRALLALDRQLHERLLGPEEPR